MAELKFRTFDGTGNNLSDTTLNAAGTEFGRIGPAHFADGVSTPLGGPNPRTISNLVVGAGDPDVANSEGLSAFMYAWGQFIDHDLTLTHSDGVNHIDITVPNGDPVLPNGTVISMTRAVTDPTTGTDPSNPATAVNTNTAWLDASMIYGSNAATAASLRLADGHMLTSDGDNLPIVNGMFAAGDPRVAENFALTSLQTLFLREHNYQVDRLAQEHPDWTGDQLYNVARAIVSAEVANITYSEFLPALLGKDTIAAYTGYDSTVDPHLTLEFAGAAFRFGHSIVSGETENLTELGEVIEGSEHDLKDVFFNPPDNFIAHSGADGQLRHLAADPSQALDARIVDGLRNFLVDPPAAMDLAAINIQRARDLGLGTLNQTRIALGLTPYSDFAQITSDPETLAGLQAAYGNVNNVGLWTGGLSENHMPGAMVGETFQMIIAMQFEKLRDGDRLWFENQGFDAETLQEIKDTTLADIIRRNTDTQHIQDDVFYTYTRHSGTIGGIEADDPDARQLVVGSDGDDSLFGGSQQDYLFAGIGTQYLSGRGGTDRLYGNSGNDTLDGGADADIMAGGVGNDNYFVGDANDVVTENTGEGFDTVYSSIHLRLQANVENLVLQGTADLQAYGNELSNSIYGNSGSNILDGGADVDGMYGGAGNDAYFIDNAGDGVIEYADEGIDTVFSTAHIRLSDNVEHLVLQGSGDIQGYGNALSNMIYGNSGANLLDGGAGADAMSGGAGNDVYFVDNPGDAVFENANEGIDLVFASAHFRLPEHVEYLILQGGDGVQGYGGAGSNTIIGSDAINLLNGGAGADVLRGNGGNDAFVFHAGEADGDSVVDFDGQGAAAGDFLQFVGYGAGATLTQVDATHWQVNYNGGTSHEVITFLNAPAINLSNDVMFI